jgi:hydrogenase expression/formation protein HypE
VALEGTSILALDSADELGGRVPESLLGEARAYRQEVSVVPEGLAATQLGATAMHDPTEGGVVSGLWELAEASGTGFRVEAARIPVRPPTRAICDALGVDPLRLISGGALLIACRDGLEMVEGLAARGVSATLIGEVTSGRRELAGRDGDVLAIEGGGRDELYRLLEEREHVADGRRPAHD